MKNLLLLLPLFALVWSCTPGDGGSSGSMEITSFIDSASYVQGHMMGKNMTQYGIEGESSIINSAVFKAGLEDGLAEKEAMISETDTEKLMRTYEQGIRAYMTKKMESGESEFFAENAKKEGVKTTPSGLQYIVVREGTGAMPTAADKVEVDYEGKLKDGKVFDSSYQKGKTVTFGVSEVISGWTEGLQLMKEGAEYQFFIPSKLGYGERGSPPVIGPNEILIFKVELKKINP